MFARRESTWRRAAGFESRAESSSSRHARRWMSKQRWRWFVLCQVFKVPLKSIRSLTLHAALTHRPVIYAVHGLVEDHRLGKKRERVWQESRVTSAAGRISALNLSSGKCCTNVSRITRNISRYTVTDGILCIGKYIVNFRWSSQTRLSRRYVIQREKILRTGIPEFSVYEFLSPLGFVRQVFCRFRAADYIGLNAGEFNTRVKCLR